MIEFHDVHATKEASGVLWDLIVERDGEQDVNISHQSMPSRAEHEAFILSDPFYLWKLVSYAGRWVGYVSVTKLNEIGIVLFMAERGQGYGKIILQKLLDEIQPLPPLPGRRSGCFLANINPENERSIRLFSASGFRLIQHTYRLQKDA